MPVCTTGAIAYDLHEVPRRLAPSSRLFEPGEAFDTGDRGALRTPSRGGEFERLHRLQFRNLRVSVWSGDPTSEEVRVKKSTASQVVRVNRSTGSPEVKRSRVKGSNKSNIGCFDSLYSKSPSYRWLGEPTGEDVEVRGALFQHVFHTLWCSVNTRPVNWNLTFLDRN